MKIEVCSLSLAWNCIWLKMWRSRNTSCPQIFRIIIFFKRSDIGNFKNIRKVWVQHLYRWWNHNYLVVANSDYAVVVLQNIAVIFWMNSLCFEIVFSIYSANKLKAKFTLDPHNCTECVTVIVYRSSMFIFQIFF